jgi:putative transposase
MNPDKFQDKYRVPSTRLKTWNYSSPGFYYVTICIKNHSCDLGKILHNKMNLSDIGKIIKKVWLSIPSYYKNVSLDEFTIMPNHIHGIIIIRNNRILGRDAINRVSTNEYNKLTRFNPMGRNSLGEIIRWFKGKSTFYIHKINPHFYWQSRYYDHIIRSEKSLDAIRFYIRYNYLNWDTDEENTCQ